MNSASTQLASRIDKSNLPKETKEILTLLTSLFNDILKVKDNKVTELKKQVNALESKVEKLENNLDETSQYERRDTIIVSGPSIPISSSGENCKTIVRDLLREKLSMNINAEDISTAHRIGKQQRNGTEDRRNIILKLCRRDLVHEIYANCRTMKPNFYVNDSLTPLRSKICYVLRQVKKKFPLIVKGCRSFNGVPRVFIHNKGPSTRQRSATNSNDLGINIATKLELEMFVREHLNTTLRELSLYL